jgi:hypothetical protein
LAKTKAALETARQYQWSRVASSFLDLYSELHRATQNSTAAAPAPEFYSTPAAGAGSVFMHTVSAMAVRTFKMLSGRCLEPRVVPRGSNVLPKP